MEEMQVLRSAQRQDLGRLFGSSGQDVGMYCPPKGRSQSWGRCCLRTTRALRAVLPWRHRAPASCKLYLRFDGIISSGNPVAMRAEADVVRREQQHRLMHRGRSPCFLLPTKASRRDWSANQ